MPVADTLLRLAEPPGLYDPRWTDEILAEVTRTLVIRFGKSRENARYREAAMRDFFHDSLVKEYEPLVEKMTNHPKDRHVLAAAVACRADYLVTFNLKHFPAAAVASHGINAIHPDEFVGKLLDAAPLEVCAAARRQRLSLRRPPRTIDEFLGTLERQRLPTTVQRLRAMVGLL